MINQIQNWPPLFNQPSPWVDPSFQEELTKIGGSLIDGRPKLRLIWGQSPEASVFWKGKKRLQYLFKTEIDFVGWKSFSPSGVRFYPPTPNPPKTKDLIVEKILEERDIGIPRWYIEQIMPAAILSQDWNEIQFDYNTETGELEDSLGPMPSLGEYQEAFYVIADHSNCCPEGKFNLGCKGEYRDPQSYDLEYVRWLMRQLQDEAFKYHWEDVPPPEVVVQSLLDRKSEIESQMEKKSGERAYEIKQSIAPKRLFGGGHFDIGQAFQNARKF